MSKIKRDLPIYVISASLAILGLTYSGNQAVAATPTISATKYNTDLAKVNKRLQDLEYSNSELKDQVLRLQNCIVNAPVSGTSATVILRNCSGGY